MDISAWTQPKPAGESTLRKLQHYQQDKETIVYDTNIEFPFPDGSLIVSRTDLNGVITHANDVFVDISGWTREEIIGAPHCILRHPDMPKSAFVDMWETLKRGERWYGYVKNLRKDGGYYWVYATVIPNFRKGEVVGYSSIRRKPARQRVNEIIELYSSMLAQEQEGK